MRFPGCFAIKRRQSVQAVRKREEETSRLREMDSEKGAVKALYMECRPKTSSERLSYSPADAVIVI